MTRLDIQLQPSPASISHSDVEAAHRLIVLVPNADLDYAAATRRVWELAGKLEARILFIGLCKDAAEESSLRRQLVTMSAMVQDGRVYAEEGVEIGKNWMDLIKRNYQTGDMIVCFAEQRTGLLHKPLSQILRLNLKIPVYILSGLYPQKSSLLLQVMAWSVLIGIVISFFLLQVNIVQLQEDWLRNILLILSIIFEFRLIWVWNNRFR